jgi:ComF family protein
MKRPPPFAVARAPLRYDFPVDSALKALKFRHQLHYAPAFAELLAGELLLHFDDADALAPVPLHPLRHALRGFNQAVELCRPLGRMSGLPIAGNLRRIRRTQAQSGLSGEARRRNLKNAFAVIGPLRCRRPVIVDDVMTTGETCRQLAQALIDAGAESVRVLTVARASSR